MKRGALCFLMIVILMMTVVSSCGDSDINPPATKGDSYDRAQLLIDVADNMIIPGYDKYVADLIALSASTSAFVDSPDLNTLTTIRNSYVSASLSWQKVSMFEIGPAEQISLRNYTNIFPTNTDEISQHITTGVYNLALPSTMDAQGLPAIDYLLFGIAGDDAAIIEYYSSMPNASAYLTNIVSRLVSLSSDVQIEWATNYRAAFIADSGSDATSSLNKLANDYIFYYERFLRAGKIGIPAGVFSGDALPGTIEGKYSKIYSKHFFLAGLNSASEFFAGTDHDSTSSGESLLSYLQYLGNDQAALGQRIVEQFEMVRATANALSDDFGVQITEDNSKMLETYDELQKNVILLKVDMLQALNIKIDFVDADGD